MSRRVSSRRMYSNLAKLNQTFLNAFAIFFGLRRTNVTVITLTPFISLINALNMASQEETGISRS